MRARHPSARGLLLCAALLGGCAGPAAQGAEAPPVQEAQVRAQLFALSADSREGRAAGSAGAARAARFIAERLRAHGVAPAGDSAYYQRVPGADVNVVGVVRGSDPALRDQAVVVGAHYDHVGIGRPAGGDSVYNGADDDASGVVAVLEIARALAAGPAPKRTVVLLLTTGEEVGLLGTRHYVERPVVPLARTVADLQIEMIGRPDSAAGGPGRGWLTGFERSTMGEALAAAGVPIVPDPRPAQDFFLRSDNIAFACRGIPAHTLSSYGMHQDYHTPDDEPERADVRHMTAVIEAATRAVRLLADGPAPAWKPGGDPSHERPCAR